MAGQTLPEKVAQIYYTYGLFCSSYPYAAIAFALSVVLLCCYPLLNVPLPGNIPTVVHIPLPKGQEVAVNDSPVFNYDCTSKDCDSDYDPLQLALLQNETLKLPYIWAKDRPYLYVQQIILKTGVFPWNSNLKLWDAFRAPLQEAFRLLETVRNHEDPQTKKSLSNLCYQVDSVKRRGSSGSDALLPEYSCLLLAPPALWRGSLQAFSLDASLVSTVYSHQNIHLGKVSAAEVAFGMQLRDAGVKRYPLRARARVLQYAVTVFYRHADQRFIKSLMTKLKEQYPLYQDPANAVQANEATLVYYPGEFNYLELVPLTITFVGLFLYVYFSVRKIESIKSKLGLAACAVLTIAGSLSMAMGICFYFGFSLSLQGKEIFPYLVIIVGLENVLVLTKSVTTTDSRLDVKIRLAQGLSKEGWSITKNLLTEITIFTVSFFTFVPFIQEFSIFMIVSLLSDYFIQMVFFATILGVDVHRMECFQEQNSKLQLKEYFANNALNWRYTRNYVDEPRDSPRMTKSKSHPRLNGLASNPTDVVAQRNGSPKHHEKVPKRIRLVNLWARTRFFQRAFMLWMLVWISMIVYNSGVVEYFVSSESEPVARSTEQPARREDVSLKNEFAPFLPLVEIPSGPVPADSNETLLLKHSPHSRPWARLSPYHWSSILSQYNESVSGRYITLLPPILLSVSASPEQALALRNPDERTPPPLRWHALAAKLDPTDHLPDPEDPKSVPAWAQSASELPIYPTTPMEILLLAILCSISVAVIAYMMMVLYRCVCSRNYAEWRASWNEKEEYIKIISKQPAVQLVMEAVPIVVSGHTHEVECLVTDGEKVVSSCLQGTVKVWDSQTGDVVTELDRENYFKSQREMLQKINSKTSSSPTIVNEVLNQPDVTSKSNENVPHLRKGLSKHLSGLRFRSSAPHADGFHISALENTKYDFAKSYRDLYCSEQSEDIYDTLEIKENIDTNNQNTLNKESIENQKLTNGDDLFVFNSTDNFSEGLRNRNKPSHIQVDNTQNSFSVPRSNSASDDVRDSNCAVVSESPIWCMDLCNDLIILGCADSRIEFWEATSGKLMCIHRLRASTSCAHGVTHVRAVGGARRVLAASLSGTLTLLRLDAYNASAGVRVDWRFSTAHRRTHKRTGSAGSLGRPTDSEHGERARMSLSYEHAPNDTDEIQAVRIAHLRPHQQPISEMHCEGGRVLTGGQDHVLKVFSSSDLSPLLTLHGHCGPITSAFIDHVTPTIAGSGSQDGLLCVWDLHTGACLYSTQAHDGCVSSLAYTASYVVSAGADERLCVWDRFQGHMLASIHVGVNYMSRMLPLTHTLLLMGSGGGLAVIDLSCGDVIRRVLLGQTDSCILVRQILPLKDAVVCDYANQLRVVRFPLVSKLSDVKHE